MLLRFKQTYPSSFGGYRRRGRCLVVCRSGSGSGAGNGCGADFAGTGSGSGAGNG
ncbi:MAG: hypothetical protein M3O33_17100 [Cyanobacteriota bacterium]|nr:hypothetical protein [Cyanobacteriota bacterium]